LGGAGQIKIEGLATQTSLVFGPVLSGPNEAASLRFHFILIKWI